MKIKNTLLNFNNKIFIAFFAMIFIIFIDSSINLIKNYSSIQNKLVNLGSKSEKKNNYEQNKLDIYWAERLIQGGYILHFRHAERDKWIDVQAYDALESHVHQNGNNGTRYAENEYFKDAVCLNSRGKIQARAIGEHLKNVKLPIGFVISSPICRSRQTAEIAFGGYDELNLQLVHKGPYNENRLDHIKKLKKLYLNLPIEKNKNTIVSGHNGTVHMKMFDNNLYKTNVRNPENLKLEEGGFFIISQKKIDNNKKELILEHQFHNFKFFSKIFYKR